MLSDKCAKVLHSANYLFIFPVFPSYIAYQQAEIILLPRFAWNYNFICKIGGEKSYWMHLSWICCAPEYMTRHIQLRDKKKKKKDLFSPGYDDKNVCEGGKY